MEGTPAYLGPVTSTYTVRDTERYPFSILPFGVTAMRAAVRRRSSHGYIQWLRSLGYYDQVCTSCSAKQGRERERSSSCKRCHSGG